MDSHLPISCEEVKQMLRQHLCGCGDGGSRINRKPSVMERELDEICEESLEKMLPELVQLVCSDHDQPMTHFAPAIRRMIEERWFIDENGDSIVNDDLEHRLDDKVHTLVTVLEEVTSRAMKAGEWSSLPAAPMMAG